MLLLPRGVDQAAIAAGQVFEFSVYNYIYFITVIIQELLHSNVQHFRTFG